jgi:hypothetical protein
MKNITLAIAVVSLAASANAQSTGLRWSLSAGPTMKLGSWRSGWVCANCPLGDSTAGARFVDGAQHGRYNAALGISKQWPGTSLTIRGDVHYSRSASPLHNGWAFFSSDTSRPPTTIESAARDETFATTLGLEWHAFPSRAVSPYLTTSAGLALNRLSWNSDTTSKRLDGQHDSWAAVTALGAGIRAKVGSHELFLEWKIFRPIGELTGAKVIPFSVGFRF